MTSSGANSQAKTEEASVCADCGASKSDLSECNSLVTKFNDSEGDIGGQDLPFITDPENPGECKEANGDDFINNNPLWTISIANKSIQK